MTRPSAHILREVRERAGECCEYCRVPQEAYRSRFCVDHVIARQHGGEDDPANLAFCCQDCNLHKGPNIAGVDPHTRAVVPLFHPRQDHWAEHFRFVGPYIEPLTTTGRATIVVLDMNSPDRLAVRELLVLEGLLPLA